MEIVEGWSSKLKGSTLDNPNEPISCDTLFKCKRKIINHVHKKGASDEARSMNNFKCVVCADYMYTEGFSLYGQGLHVCGPGSLSRAQGHYNHLPPE